MLKSFLHVLVLGIVTSLVVQGVAYAVYADPAAHRLSTSFVNGILFVLAARYLLPAIVGRSEEVGS